MLDPRELATVLAALRHWQHQLARQGLALADAFPHFADEPPLSMEEIDSLCDRLNDFDSPCECERPRVFCSGVPGVLARMEQGRLAPNATVERCDLCQRYASDDAARQRLIELSLA